MHVFINRMPDTYNFHKIHLLQEFDGLSTVRSYLASQLDE